MLDLETTRQQCEKKMEKIEKENYMESRKLAWLNRSRRAEGKKNQTATHFHKPVWNDAKTTNIIINFL